ncbi:MAG: DUF2190 family protein [Dehalococcoidales bacterium]|nr:DUF2190 family protein [Dehalococcoidales bacterium]
MPYGVYTAGTAGDEVSSTYEGRHLTFSESQLTHPTHADGFVDKGDPVLVGENIVGVAFLDAAAATDLIPIDTEGIWQLSVVATNQNGNSAVAVGDELFINKSTCIISKNYDKNVSVRFGYALYPITGGATDVIPVKVHFDPDDELEQVGVSATEREMGTTLQHAREYRYRSTKTSGIARLGYCALSLAGAGVSGDVWRRRCIVEAVGVATAMGGHDGLEFDADGTITGLGVGHRATFMQPNRAAFATIAGGMSELWAEGASTDFGAATVHSIHRFVMDGDPTGCATADNVFEFVNLSAVQYAANTDTPDHALRCIINGNIRYIMVSEAQS